MSFEELAQEAIKAKSRSIPTYSNFHVGSALLTEDGKIYSAGNIESSSYSLTICAERTAIFKALSEGERKFKSIAVASDAEDFCPPCGACRQVMNDFLPEADVVLINSKNEIKTFKVNELIPLAFGDKNLK